MDGEKKKKRIARLRARLAGLEYTPRSDWNSAFEALLRINMHKYGSHVSIKAEHRLGEEPPRVDYLILKGGSGVDLGKGIFRIFRGHNIIEYKNPCDALNGRVIRKVCGYANFYIGVAEHERDVRSDDVTVSVFRAVRNCAEINCANCAGYVFECAGQKTETWRAMLSIFALCNRRHRQARCAIYFCTVPKACKTF